MKALLLALLLLIVAPCIAQGVAAVTALKVRIEAPELDKSLLLDKLNQHGSDHRLKV